MLELVCVRHGQTAWNAELRFQGQSDIPLDDEGCAQAQLVADELASRPLAFGVTSDLRRSVQTAKIILENHPHTPLRLDQDLREMAFGEWEGLTWTQIVERDPKLALDGGFRAKAYLPPGGESFETLVTRVERAVERIRAEAFDDARVLVVTHAGVLHALLRIILPETESSALEVRFVPGGITRFALDARGGGRLLALNQLGCESPR